MLKYSSLTSFLFYNFVTIFNFFCTTYILLILSFAGYVSLAGEGFIVLSIIQLLTFGFSSNLRNMYATNKNIISFEKIISFRLLTGTVSFILSCTLIFYFVGAVNIDFHITLALLIVLSWIFEIILVKNELEKKINKFFLYNSICLAIIIPIIIILTYIDILIIIILFYSLLNILTFREYLFQPFDLIINSFQINIKKLKLGISSTFLKYIANLIFRYSAFFLIGSYKAGLLFVAFSMGSLLGTLFDVSYGAFFSKSSNKNKNFFFYYFIFGYVLISILSFYIFNLYSKISINDLFFLKSAFIPSIIGGIIMVHALMIRQKLFEKKHFQQTCFKADIVGYFVIILLIPSLFYIKETYVTYAYFLSSSFIYVIYLLLKNDIIKK